MSPALVLLSRQADFESALDAYQTAVKQSGGIYPEAYYHMGLDHVRVTYLHNGRSERPTIVSGEVIREALV